MLKRLMTTLLLLAAVQSHAAPLETTFTYQGELRESGAPANGAFDFQFELLDAASGGASVGSAQTVEDVSVVDGLFAVELDFGAEPFAGDQLWLEIGVRDGASTGGFTGLLPLQKLTAAPYALHAEMVAANAIAGPEIANNSVAAADIAANAVGSSEIINSQVQQRVDGVCAAGSYLTAVNQDGSVSCDADGIGEFAAALSIDDQQRIGVSSPTPLAPLSIGSNNNWFWGVGNGRGDLFIGDDAVGLSLGVALDGFGRGAARMWTKGGVEELFLGSEIYGDELALRNGRIGLNTASPQTDVDIDGQVRIRDLSHAGPDARRVAVSPAGDLLTDGLVEIVSVPSAAFMPRRSNIEYSKSLFNGGAFVTSSATTFAGLVAPVNLPHQSVIERVEATYWDDSTADLELTLRCEFDSSGFAVPIASYDTTGAVSSFRQVELTIDPNQQVVRNDVCTYFVLAYSDDWGTALTDLGIKTFTIQVRLP